jgi:hypothetical protein
LPAELKEILRKSLAESPETRTGSFDELLLLIRCSEEKVVAGLINDAEFSIDVSPGAGFLLMSTLFNNPPETDTSVPQIIPLEQSYSFFSRGREATDSNSELVSSRFLESENQ